MDNSLLISVVEKIRKDAKRNWDWGKEQESIKRIELIKNFEILEAKNLNYEWRRVNWFIDDGWNESIKFKLQKLGYIVTEFEDSMNVWIDWKGATPP